MISFVYCYVCLLFIAATHSYEAADEVFNDQNYLQPEIKTVRVIMGNDVLLKCNLHHVHPKSVIWEFKPCETNYRGVDCDTKTINDINADIESWRKLQFNRTRSRLLIQNSNDTNNGLYRCTHNGFILKSFIVEIVNSVIHQRPPPFVEFLKITNSTDQMNLELTILCNISSKIPPTILWFKRCHGLKFDIKYDNISFCHINVSSSLYNIGNTYLSKINLINVRHIDSGLYACLAVTEFGKDYKYVTIDVPDFKEEEQSSFWLFLLIAFVVLLTSSAFWLCYYKRKKKLLAKLKHQQQLLKPVPAL